jgi:hypothetical protein
MHHLRRGDEINGHCVESRYRIPSNTSYVNGHRLLLLEELASWYQLTI